MSRIFAISPSRQTYVLFALILFVLTVVTFGSLHNHLYDAFDDKEHIEVDIARSLEDPNFLFSPARTYLVRPITDIILMVCYTFWENDARPYHLLVVFFHYVNALLLVFLFRRTGLDIELCLIAGILFFLNVAHFRAIHWITCLDRVLALTWALVAYGAYFQYLHQKRLWLLCVALLTLSASIFSHPSSVAVSVMLGYLAFRHTGHLRETVTLTWHIALITVVIGFLTYLVSPHHPQVGGVTGELNPLHWVQNILWYMGRTVTAAHWLPDIALSSSWNAFEILVGGVICVGILILYRRQQFPVADWGIWAIVMVLPFLNHPPSSERWLPVGPSRHLYLSTVGTSLILGWILRLGVEKFFPAQFRRYAFGGILLLLIGSSVWALKASEATSYYLSGRRYAAEKDFELAEDRFLNALVVGPTKVPQDIFYRLAGISFAHGRFPQKEFEFALQHRPDNLELQVLVALSHYLEEDTHQIEMANQKISSILNRSPDPSELLLLMARVTQNLGGFYQKNKNYSRAEKIYQLALQFKPDYAMAWYNLGNTLNAQQKPQRAIEAYHKALSIDPSYIEPLQNLANILFEKGELASAQTMYEEILEQNPADEVNQYNLGMIFLSQGDLGAAQERFEKVLLYSPKDIEARLKLAEIFYAQEQFNRALTLYREILEDIPGQTDAAYNAAVLLLQFNRPDDAITLLNKTLTFASQDVDVLFALAVAYEKLPEIEQARKMYARVLEIVPDHIDATHGLLRLEE